MYHLFIYYHLSLIHFIFHSKIKDLIFIYFYFIKFNMYLLMNIYYLLSKKSLYLDHFCMQLKLNNKYLEWILIKL